MKSTLLRFTGLILSSLITSNSLNAFDILVSYTPMNEQTYKTATDNVGLEIGHYKNTNKEGFGFGWRLAATTPLEGKWLDGGTAEVGIAPGYTLVENLDLMIEVGLGLHSYNSYDVAFGGYIGAGLSYAAFDHLYLGVSARNWIMNATVQTVEDAQGNDMKESYSDLRGTAYLGYRF